MEISDGLAIADYSMANAQISIMQKVSTQMLAKTLDTMEAEGAQLTKMMEQSVTPNLGQNIDVRI